MVTTGLRLQMKATAWLIAGGMRSSALTSSSERSGLRSCDSPNLFLESVSATSWFIALISCTSVGLEKSSPIRLSRVVRRPLRCEIGEQNPRGTSTRQTHPRCREPLTRSLSWFHSANYTPTLYISIRCMTKTNLGFLRKGPIVFFKSTFVAGVNPENPDVGMGSLDLVAQGDGNLGFPVVG